MAYKDSEEVVVDMDIVAAVAVAYPIVVVDAFEELELKIKIV